MGKGLRRGFRPSSQPSFLERCAVPQVQFHHRWDESHVFESACKTCFRIVARAQTEADLAAQEMDHHCDPQYLTFSRLAQVGKILPK